MSDIIIRRQHGKSLAEARAAAEHMAGELGKSSTSTTPGTGTGCASSGRALPANCLSTKGK
jgi:hypothetical protein